MNSKRIECVNIEEVSFTFRTADRQSPFLWVFDLDRFVVVLGDKPPVLN